MSQRFCIVLLSIIGHAFCLYTQTASAQETVSAVQAAATTQVSVPCTVQNDCGPELLDWVCPHSLSRCPKSTKATTPLSPLLVIHARSRGLSGTGTGFLLQYGTHTYVVTAKHVLEDARVGLEFEDTQGRPLRLEYSEFYMHPWADIALAQLQRIPAGVRVYPLYTGAPYLNDTVHALGIVPGRGVLDYNGKLLGRYFSHPSRDDAEGYQTDSAIIPGMSGGPLLYEGAVLGVNSSRAAMDTRDRTSYHTSIRYALDMMARSTAAAQ